MSEIGNIRRARAAGLTTLLLAPLAQAASPEVAALLARAELAAGAGPERAKEAWELFGRAWSLAPGSALPARGICRLGLALGLGTEGQRDAARAACQQALLLGGTPEDMRNRAAAAVAGAVRPTMEDVVAASIAADGAFRTGPGQLWGPRARVDLALRLGDRAMLDGAIEELRRMASEHPQTRQAVALSAARASLGVWLGRLAFALVVLWTAVRAFVRWLRRRGRDTFRTASAGSVVLAIVLASSGTAVSAVDPLHPEAGLPTPAQQLADPLAFANLVSELTAGAEKATARGDHAAAARFHGALAQAFPDRAYGYARLCEALEASGELERAIIACRTALTRQGTTASDYTRFVRVLLAQPGPLTASDRRQVAVVLAQLDAEPRAALIAQSVRCDVALRDHDRGALEACTAKLAAAAPDDPRTASFQWALAVEARERASAERALGRARTVGVDVAALERMRRTTEATFGGGQARAARALRWAAVGAMGSLLALLLVAAAARLRGGVRRRPVSS